ncbi:helix-turn-helix domain-containing protein [Clostridium saccharoperbutylacetonicum]|uniref:helix-turn-helix domain-containing protein n=1 Tax=Clostridium saccharoperbutylacetonicum TaxID=36745 RepID=UPI0039E94B7A
MCSQINNEINNIAKAIKSRRQELNMSYQDLADKTHLSKSTLQRYETGGIKNIPLDKLTIICTALEIPLSYLIETQETLTNKLIRALEINFNTDADNTLELICELTDIDAEVIDEALKNNEDISESYLSKMIDIIYKDNPNLFLDFYSANKKLIDDSYSICSYTCNEILKKIKIKGILDEVDDITKKYHRENEKKKVFNNRFDKTINITENDIKNYLFSIVKDILESSNSSTDLKYKLSDFSKNEIKEIGLFLYNSYQLKVNEILERHKNK